MASASTSPNWAQLRQQARQLESQTETLFHSYSQFSTTPNIPVKPSDDESRTDAEISSLLTQRDTIVSSLSRLLDSDAQPSALKSSHLARHRETLAQHRTDLNRIRGQISSARDRANLLTSVRSDINAYRASNPENEEAEYMLQERGRIDNSHNMVDSVLSQAYAVNENFGIQREQLERIRLRITSAVGTMPGMNQLMTRIGSKRRRDGIVLGSFIAFCFLMVWWFS